MNHDSSIFNGQPDREKIWAARDALERCKSNCKIALISMCCCDGLPDMPEYDTAVQALRGYADALEGMGAVLRAWAMST